MLMRIRLLHRRMIVGFAYFRYVMDPELVDGYKTSFRVYVLITSYDPLRVYIFPDGLTRICSEKYSADVDTMDNLYQHLTNVDINHVNEAKFVENISDDIDNDGLRLYVVGVCLW